MPDKQKAPTLATLGAPQNVHNHGGLNDNQYSENTLQRQALYVAKRCAVPASLAAVIAALAFRPGTHS
jgi:hypothetical protein